jgi:sigma-B regulation protein RsbU (phosphoserine phosphatase)
VSTPDSDPPFGADALYDTAACGLLLTHADGRIIRANLTFCRWLGYEPADLQGAGRRLQDLFSMGARIFHQTHWAPLLQIQGSMAEVKVDLIHRDGRKIPIVMNALLRQHGGVLCQEVAAFVMEDRHKYEQELLAAKKKAELLLAKERAVALFAEQMIGIVSHDLRQPLAAVRISAHLLGRGALSPKQHSILGRIISSTQRANRLIGDLLDFTVARLGAGLSVHPRELDLHGQVADSVEELSTALPGRQLHHQRFGEGETLVDGDRLAQLIGNLVGNAVSYGDPTQPITITSQIEPHEFWVAVHNHGQPIPADVLPTLFEPMVRGGTPTASERSVGLGLFIVKEIVRAHQGHMSASSTLEAGTRFCAAFPR